MKNKMGDTQKMAFLKAMRQSEPDKKQEIEQSKEDTTIFHDTVDEIKKQPHTMFRTRAERRAAATGYTRPVAPLPVDERDEEEKQTRRKAEKDTVIKRHRTTIIAEEEEEEKEELAAEKEAEQEMTQAVNIAPRKVTVDDLYDALAQVQDYRSQDYTKATWLPFVNAFTQALEVYQSDEPTMEELMVANDALKAAKEQLIKR